MPEGNHITEDVTGVLISVLFLLYLAGVKAKKFQLHFHSPFPRIWCVYGLKNKAQQMSAFKQWGNFLANLCNSSGYILSSPLLLGTNTIAVVLLCSIRIIFLKEVSMFLVLKRIKAIIQVFIKMFPAQVSSVLISPARARWWSRNITRKLLPLLGL